MVLDIIILIIFLSMIFLGWRRGFVRTVMGFLGTIISLVAAYLLYGQLTKAMLRNDKINSKALQVAENSLSKIDFAKLFSSLPLPKGITGLLGNAAGATLTPALTKALISIFSMFIVFIAVFIVLKVVQIVLELIAGLPVISFANRLLGVCAGAIGGYIWVYLIALAATALLPVIPALNGQLANSVCIKYLLIRFRS